MDKKEIAAILEEIANLLEIKDENPFRVRAYRNAARTLLNSEESLKMLIQEEKLTDLEGIGEDLAEKITILASKQKLPFYEKLKKSIPRGMLTLLEIQGLGPKKAKILFQKLGIQSIQALKKACLNQKIRKIKGFGKKTEENILDAIGHKETYQKRRLWWDAMQAALPILSSIKKLKGVKQVEIAGSLRRKLETVGDLDFVASAAHTETVTNWFVSQSFTKKIIAQGPTKASIKLKDGMQADLRVVSEEQFGFALFYFTGSKEHNIKIRERSLKKGWSLSEYGFKGKRPPIFSKKKQPSEQDLYQSLSLSYIPPELRENRGEIEAALQHKIPHLVEEKDIRGTFHNHTNASDGKSSLKEMLQAAEEMGWEYIGISDHSKSSVQANGLSVERLFDQIEEIKKLNRSKIYKIHIFSGTECDILANGSLDFSDDLLKKLDFVIGSVHSSLSQDEKTMTKRIIRAIEHPLLTMLGHPTGRLLLRREGYKVHMQKIIDACIANKKIIEINGNPQRLDMDWRLWHSAIEKGLLCCINTDAHDASHHAFIQTGINVARKGWLTKEYVFNTRSLAEIKRYLTINQANQ